MSKTWDDLARRQRVFCKLRKNLHGGFFSPQCFPGCLQPAQALLVCKAMQRASQSVHTRRKRVVWVAQGTANKMCCVSRNITTLMVGMYHQVEPRDFLESISVIHTQHMSIIARPIKLLVTGDVFPIKEDVAEDTCGENGNLSYQTQAILKHISPIVGLFHQAATVSSSKLTCGLQRKQSHRQLCHGVHVLGQTIDEINDI
mmetsp:Transcript_103308/g.200172  ORF Transcript_103308/g.200172 Transcript_103308/m.200172 type:complete len:201 (-) Transcript_103308:386-988(-)